MAAPMEHMGVLDTKISFPLRSGASLVRTRPLFSYDNKLLLVCSSTVIKVYSTQSGECVRELQGHKAQITGIVVHPTNKLKVISCSLDKRLFLWDYTDGVLLKEISLHGTSHGIYSYEGQDSVFLLQRTANEDECQLVSVRVSGKGSHRQDMLIEHCTADARHTSVGVKGRCAAAVNDRKLLVKDIRGKAPLVKHFIEKGLNFTCVACHPTNDTIATGCSDGKIYLWYKFYSDATAVKVTLHWHSVAVLDVCFSQEGSYLLSGGHECTLVKWQVESGTRDYKPRLGAPINHLACSRDNLLYATCHDDNVIQVVSSTFVVQQVYQGLTRGHLDSVRANTAAPVPTGLTCDPRSNALVMNGKPGHVQFFSTQEDRQLYNLDIVGHNYISAENLERPLTITEVVHADFDSTGAWLATVEYWSDDQFSPEIRLKFWHYDQEHQSYVLNTTVEMAHSQKIACLKMRPLAESSAPGTQHMAVTTSEDGKFKIWTLVDDTDIYRENVKWNCESVGFYRNHGASEAAFSEDGSLLAVVFEGYITLWDPETNLHRDTLHNSVKQEPVRQLVFGVDSCSQYLVSTTSSAMTVWDLITCSVCWSVNMSTACLARDPRSDLMAAFTTNKDLFVFRPSCPDPVFSHPAVSSSPVLSAVFIPHGKKSVYEETTLSWQAQSELFFINNRQELQCVALQDPETGVKTRADRVDIEQNLPQTALAHLMKGHTNRSEVKANQGQLAVQPNSKYIRELLSSASHVQPSVTSICKTFLHSLMIQRHSARHGGGTGDDDDDDENSEEDMSWQPSEHTDSDNDDMDTDNTVAQSDTGSEKTKTQSRAPAAKTVTQSKLDTSLGSDSKHTELKISLAEVGTELSWYTKGLKT